jgi:hypothetical protein
MSVCGIDSGIDAIGLNCDRSAVERPFPDVRERTGTGRVVAVDYDVPWVQPVAIGWQGRRTLLDSARRSGPGAPIG